MNEINEINKEKKEIEINFITFPENENFNSFKSSSRPIISSISRKKCYLTENYPSQAMKEMHNFYESGRFCDIIIKTNNENFEISCHKLILAASSPYFDSMFKGNMVESFAQSIHLKNINGHALKKLIDHAYTSKLEIDSQSALEMFETADMLQLDDLRVYCEDFLLKEVTEKNCISFLEYAYLFNSELLYETSLNIIAQNFNKIRKDKKFLNLNYFHIKKILLADNLEVGYEEYVYEALKDWLLENFEEREKYLVNLFGLIRLNFVSRWYLLNVISVDFIISNNEDCMKIVQNAKDQLLAWNLFYETSWQPPPSRKCTGFTWKIIYICTHYYATESQIILFDPVNKSWSSINNPHPLASNFSSCLAIGNSLFISGGFKNHSSSLSPKSALDVVYEFKVHPIFPTLWFFGVFKGPDRYLHSITNYKNNIFFIGGINSLNIIQNNIILFDINNKKNIEFAHMKKALYKTSSCYYEDKLFIFCGIDKYFFSFPWLQILYIKNKKWKNIEIDTAHNKNFNSFNCHYSCVINDFIYFIIGKHIPDLFFPAKILNFKLPIPRIDFIAKFCPRSLTFFEKTYDLPEPREGLFSITNIKNKIYITGGTSLIHKNSLLNIICFDTLSDIWESCSTFKEQNGGLGMSTSLKVMHENFGY